MLTGAGVITSLTEKGTPDATFGKDGVVSVDRWKLDYSGRPLVRSLLFQPDGKVVVSGHTIDFVYPEGPFMFRVNADGSHDRSFGFYGGSNDWRRFWYQTFGGAALDRRGRIVVVGSRYRSAVMVRRFTRDGLIDRSFGKRGVLGIWAGRTNTGHMLSSVKVLSSGRILAAGAIRSRPVIVAVTPGGKIDRRFGQNGFAWGPKVPPQDCGPDHSAMCVESHLVRLSDGRFLLGANRLIYGGWYRNSGALIAFHPDGRRARGYGHHGVLRLLKGQVARGTGRPTRGPMNAGAVVPLSRGRVFVFGYNWNKDGPRKVGVLVNRKGHPIRVRRPVFMGPENGDLRYEYPTSNDAATRQPNGKVLVAAWENSPGNTTRHPRQNVALYRLKIPR